MKRTKISAKTLGIVYCVYYGTYQKTGDKARSETEEEGNEDARQAPASGRRLHRQPALHGPRVPASHKPVQRLRWKRAEEGPGVALTGSARR